MVEIPYGFGVYYVYPTEIGEVGISGFFMTRLPNGNLGEQWTKSPGFFSFEKLKAIVKLGIKI